MSLENSSLRRFRKAGCVFIGARHVHEQHIVGLPSSRWLCVIDPESYKARIAMFVELL